MQTVKSLWTAAAVMIAFSVTAQSVVGLRGGINLANVSDIQLENNQSIDPENIVGLHFGLFTELGISNSFAIQPELNFLQKGSEVSDINIEGTPRAGSSLKVRINYLEVPVLAKARFGENKLTGFLMAGPSLGYAMGGKSILNIDGNEVKEDIEFDKDIDDDGVKDRRWDFSAVVGGGAALAAGPGNVLLDLRYGWDLTDFSKFKNDQPAGYKESYNRTLGISLGYMFPIGK